MRRPGWGAGSSSAGDASIIVRDAHFRRLKVKSPQYVAMAHLKDGMTPRRLLEVIRANESSTLQALERAIGEKAIAHLDELALG